jgi:hypothetical protein
MFKVEIFSEASYIELQKKINKFIENKEFINVSLSTYMAGYATYNRAVVLYKD